jgi:hypothetical protein
MLSCLVDSDDLEEDDLVRHHHYIACKDHDKTIIKEINSFGNLDLLTQSTQQQDQLNQTNNNSLQTKRIMLVEDEDNIALLFNMIVESDAGLKVDSFTDPFSALNKPTSGTIFYKKYLLICYICLGIIESKCHE